MNGWMEDIKYDVIPLNFKPRPKLRRCLKSLVKKVLEREMNKQIVQCVERALIGNNIEQLIVSDRPVIPQDRIHSNFIQPFFRHASQTLSKADSSIPPIVATDDEASSFGVIITPPAVMTPSRRASELIEEPGPKGLKPPSPRKRGKTLRQNPTEKLKISIEEMAATTVPRSIQLQLLEECLPLLDRCMQFYVNQLGEKHPITVSFEEHVLKMNGKFSILTSGSLDHININVNDVPE